jgi:AcrR family transcriptional regulator
VARTDRHRRQRLDPETRRAAILAAAGQTFSRAPYDQVGVAEIAAAAGASEALVHRYFTSKGELYRATIEAGLAALLQRQAAADAALGPGADPRDRIARSLEVYLDFVAARPTAWAAPILVSGPGSDHAAAARRDNRRTYVRLLRDVLDLDAADRPATDNAALDYALGGYLGFVDAACLAWVEGGCDPRHRPALIRSAVAALFSAVGASLGCEDR